MSQTAEQMTTAPSAAPATQQAVAAVSPELQQIFELRSDFYNAEDKEKSPETQKVCIERRRQAANVYPFLAPMLPTLPILRLMIDNAAPIGPTLMSKFGISKSALKRINGLSLPSPTENPLSVEDHRMRVQIVKLIDQIDPNWMPKNESDKRAFFEAVIAVGYHLATATNQPVPALLSAAKGKWQDFLDRIWKQAYPTEKGHDPRPYDFHALKVAADDAHDMATQFAQQVIIPVIGHANEGEPVPEHVMYSAVDLAADILFSGKTAGAILELSHYWHRREDHEVVNDFMFENPDQQWPAMTDNYLSSNGFLVRALTSSEELKQESDRMNHCVRGYSWACARGGSFIISIRSPDDAESHVTAELRIPSREPLKVMERQVRGEGNRTPPAEPRAAYDEWIGKGRSGEIKIHFDLIDRHKQDLEAAIKAGNVKNDGGRSHRIDIDPVRAICGYEYMDPDRLAAAMEAWFPADRNQRSWIGGGHMPRTAVDFLRAFPTVADKVREIYSTAPILEELGEPDKPALAAP